MRSEPQGYAASDKQRGDCNRRRQARLIAGRVANLPDQNRSGAQTTPPERTALTDFDQNNDGSRKMSNDFAKLYSTDAGQILVKLDSGEDGAPEIRVFAKPEELGVCSVALQFDDSDEGWDKAEAAFVKVDVSMAERIAAQIFELID